MISEDISSIIPVARLNHILSYKQQLCLNVALPGCLGFLTWFFHIPQPRRQNSHLQKATCHSPPEKEGDLKKEKKKKENMRYGDRNTEIARILDTDGNSLATCFLTELERNRSYVRS